MRQSIEKTTERLLQFLTIVSMAATIAIFLFMVMLALPLLREGHFPGLLVKSWDPQAGSYGVLPMIIGTLLVALTATILAFPLSLGVAGLIAGIAPRFVCRWLRRLVQLMTGVPSVIYGFVGVFLLAPLVRNLLQLGTGTCLLTASLMLSVLVTPTMILFFSDSFARVPAAHLHVADSLGATPVQRLLFVTIPCSTRGIVTGTMLGLARAFGDTLVALMLAGNATAMPHSPLDSGRTLTSHIALVTAADVDSLEFRSIFVCGIVLYALTTVIILSIRRISANAWRASQ